MSTTAAYAITSHDIEAERRRAGGDPAKMDLSRIIVLRQRELPALGRRDVKLKILAVSAEHNVSHAAAADIVDIVASHGGVMYPGNSAVAEVLEVGPDVTAFKPGEIVATHCNAQPDRAGYPITIWAFDAPGSIGWYCREAIVGDWQLIHLPLDRSLSLWELAALPLRAPTAYHLWRRALGIYRVKVPREKRARLNVLSFGGGVGELFSMLAKAEGHAAYFCGNNSSRLAALADQGIAPIDQKPFHRFAHAEDVRSFRARCRELTEGEGMHIVCDMLRGPVFQAGLAAAAREGTNVSAGWQLSREVTYNSARLSISQVTLDHSHYETIEGCLAATELYGRVFRPIIHDEVYPFEALPRCFEEMKQGKQTGIPIVRVADELPAIVQPLV